MTAEVTTGACFAHLCRRKQKSAIFIEDRALFSQARENTLFGGSATLQGPMALRP
jgi:hypothetical protein